MLDPRNRPDSQPAIPNPQGFGSGLPSAPQQAGYPGITPHGNIRAVPQYSGHNPSAGHPQAVPQPMHPGNTMHAGNAPGLNGQSGPMGNYPTTSMMGQGAGPGFLPGIHGELNTVSDKYRPFVTCVTLSILGPFLCTRQDTPLVIWESLHFVSLFPQKYSSYKSKSCRF